VSLGGAGQQKNVLLALPWHLCSNALHIGPTRNIANTAFPKADKVAEILNEPGFVDWRKKQFPLRKDLRQPFELYQAALEKLESKPKLQ
jgi:hypothetical protein